MRAVKRNCRNTKLSSRPKTDSVIYLLRYLTAMFEDELSLAVNAIREAAELYVGGQGKAELKTNPARVFDIVTPGDNMAENLIKMRISKRYQDDRFICEESANETLTDSRTWVIDPIDGTVNYSRGIPIYGTQLALLVDKEPVLAVIYIPELDWMFTATESEGALLNGAPMNMSKNKPLSETIVSIGDFSRRNHEFRKEQACILQNMYDTVGRIKIFGASCYDFALFASGRSDIHLRFVSNPWDYMPGMYISKKAGAHYNEQYLKEHKLLVMASSPNMLDEFCSKVLKSVYAGTDGMDRCERAEYETGIVRKVCQGLSRNNAEAVCIKYGFPYDINEPDLLKIKDDARTHLKSVSESEIIRLACELGLIADERFAFIVHSGKDKEHADLLASILSDMRIGYYCSSDSEYGTDPGSSFHDEIKDKIIRSDRVIVLLSSNSIGSPYCLQEIGAALIMNKPILPIITDDTVPESMPGFLDNTRYQAMRLDGSENKAKLVKWLGERFDITCDYLKADIARGNRI